jgi:hypothetical protein
MTYEATYIAAGVAENWGQYETHCKTYCPEPRGRPPAAFEALSLMSGLNKVGVGR